MNRLDTILQTEAPMVMVPRYEPLEPIRPNSHRFLSCEDGIYLEAHRPWLHGIFKLCDCRLPYGQVSPRFGLKLHSTAFGSMLSTFIQAARNACPQEHAAWITYHPDESGALHYFAPNVFSTGHEHVQYERPRASSQCLPVIDFHSHGLLPAFFSSTDDCDDLGDDLKIAIVVGNLDKETPSVAARLVGLGVNIVFSKWVESFVQNDITETLLS